MQTLVSLFGCVLDFLSEIRRWVVVEAGSPPPSTAAPSIVDLWAMQRLGLECSRVLGVWVAEDPESLPQRFLEALPVLLALNAGAEVRGEGWCGLVVQAERLLSCVLCIAGGGFGSVVIDCFR